MRSPLPLGIERDADYDDEELTADQKRTARAVTEEMVVVPRVDADGVATGIYDVLSASGNSYAVEADAGACNCPDATYRQTPENGGCKHVRRVRLLGRLPDVPLPAAGDPIGEYADLLADLVDILDARKNLLWYQVHRDSADYAPIPPGTPTDEYRMVDWFLSALREHDTVTAE